MSIGCHALLRDGAILVETVDDVFEALGPLAQTASRATGEDVRHPAELQLNQQEKQVLCCIETQPTEIDQIVAESRLPVQRVLATLSALEVRHVVRRLGGNKVVRI
jgi:DNA processing protein